MLRCKHMHAASCCSTAGKADGASSACRFPNSATSQPLKPLPPRHKPPPSSWKRTGCFHNASPSMGHSSSSRHQHIPPGNSSLSALGTQGLCWGPSGRQSSAGRAAGQDAGYGLCHHTRGCQLQQHRMGHCLQQRPQHQQLYNTAHVFFYKTKKKKGNKSFISSVTKSPTEL